MAKYVPPSRRDGSFLSDQHDSLVNGMKQLAVQEEYPALPKKSNAGANASAAAKASQPQPQPQPVGRATYASLASNWAEQVKINEEKAKKAAEEEEIKTQLRKKANEVRVIPVRKSVVEKKRSDSDDDKELDIGCHVSDHSEHSDPSDYADDVVEDEDEEEVEEDPDAFWTQRKHKGDMY